MLGKELVIIISAFLWHFLAALWHLSLVIYSRFLYAQKTTKI